MRNTFLHGAACARAERVTTCFRPRSLLPIPINQWSKPVSVVTNGFYPKTRAWVGAEKVFNICSLNLAALALFISFPPTPLLRSSSRRQKRWVQRRDFNSFLYTIVKSAEVLSPCPTEQEFRLHEKISSCYSSLGLYLRTRLLIILQWPCGKVSLHSKNLKVKCTPSVIQQC
jgi:hypothetical protein